MYFKRMDASLLAVGAEPPNLLHLASHPVRWRIMRALARSDCKVQELTELVGEPQNLVSFHLGKLRSGALVAARRSSADRRDCYYTLNLTEIRSLLSEAGAALHPGLRLIPTTQVAWAPRGTKILFLCTGNSARSQIAEALVKARSGGVIKAYSAGSAPKPVHPNAIRAMREAYGLDLSRQKSKHLEKFAEQRFDCVVSLCDRLREICPDFPGSPETIHWSIENPASDAPDAATYPQFQTVVAEISHRVDFLLAALSDRAIPTKARVKS